MRKMTLIVCFLFLLLSVALNPGLFSSGAKNAIAADNTAGKSFQEIRQNDRPLAAAKCLGKKTDKDRAEALSVRGKKKLAYDGSQMEQDKKVRTVGGKVLENIFKQLLKDEEIEYDPEIDELATKPAKHFIKVQTIPFIRDAYLVTGIYPPFIGSHASRHWIYKKTATGYKQLFSLGAYDNLYILKSSHNGYPDIQTEYYTAGEIPCERCILIFDGCDYVDAGCNRCKESSSGAVNANP